MATAQSSHRFDQRSWRIIKEFIGIYGIKMDYTKITKLSRDKLSNAYFKVCKFPTPKVSVTITIIHDCNGNPSYQYLPAIQPKTAKQWKALILKRVAQGYKNRQFYETVAKMVTPPPKVTCVCGLKMGPNIDRQQAHYRTRNHINRMLRCVPVSKVADSRVPAWQRGNSMGNSYTLVVRKWSNHQWQFLVKQIDLRPYMEQRERFNGTICYTMDDILAGGWVPGW